MSKKLTYIQTMATTLCKRKKGNKQLVKKVERFNGTKVKVNPIYLTYNNH